MTVKVTLDLPNSVVEHAGLYSRSTHRTLEDVLSDSLEILWPLLENTDEQSNCSHRPKILGTSRLASTFHP